MMHCAATLSSTMRTAQPFAKRLVDLLGVRDRRLRAGLQAGERAGGGRAAQRLFQRQAGIEPGAEIAAERVAGADRVDRRDLQRRDGKIALRRGGDDALAAKRDDDGAAGALDEGAHARRPVAARKLQRLGVEVELGFVADDIVGLAAEASPPRCGKARC